MMENNDNISKLYGALNRKYFGPQKLNISEDDFRSYLNKEQGAADSIYKYLDDEDKAAMGNDVNNLRAYISDGMKASASPIAKPAPVQSQGNKAATPKPSLSFFDRAKTAWENAIGGDEQTIRDGETPDEAAHRIANEQGTANENAAYELAKQGYQQAGKGRPTAYSYTQNALAKRGIVSSDPASEGHRDLVNGTNRFAADVAQRTVDDIMSRIAPQSSDPVQELQDNYYSRDVLNRVWSDADRLGFDYNDYLNLFVRPQLEKSMVAKYGKELGQRSRGIFDNYEGTYNEIENREVAADMRRSLAPSIKEAIDSAWNDTHKTVGGFGLDRYRSGKRANISATTGHIDYDALEKSLSDNVDGMLSHILHDKQSMSRWAKRAAERNMSLQDYVSQFVVPQVQNEVMHEFERYATEKNTPQNAIDYLKAKLNNSLTMSLVNTFRNTESENRYQSQGLAEVEAGRGAYKPSTVTRAAGLGAEMVPDFWMWAGWGRVGAEAGQAMLESRITSLAAKKGLSLNAARLQVENEAKHYLGERAKQYLLHSIPSSAITMAGASATGQLGADIRDRKSVSKAIDDYFSTFGHSLGTGAAFGAVGATSRALTAPLAGLKKVLGKAVSFGATVATLDATENGMSAITGDNKESAIDKLIRAGWNQIAMDLSSKSPMETIRKVQHLFSTPISDTLRNSMKSTEMPGTLSASQLQEVNNSAEGQNLKASLDILLDAKRAKKSDVIDLSNSFDSFMQSSDIRCTTKKAVADMLDAPYQLPLETDAEIIPNDDGTGTVTVRFTGSKGEHVDDMLFPTQGDAESFLANSEDKFEHNKALENWDASNEQQRMSAIVETLKADGKPYTQDNLRSVLEAFKNGTESEKFRDSLEKVLNPANRYGYDEQSRNKGYNTKTEEAYAVVDAFNTVTAELRGIKGLWNIMMQNDALEALPIIEKEYGMEVAQKAAQWYNGREAYDGIVSAAKDRAAESAKKEYDSAVPVTYKQNGDDIVSAEMNGEQGFIVNSTKDLFAMLDTGEDGVVDFSVDGNVRSIRLSQLDNVTRSSNKQKYEENLATFEEQEMNKVSYAPGTPDVPQVGDVFRADGKEYTVIAQPDENGQVQYFKVPTADGKAVGNPEPIDINEYKQAKSDEITGKQQEQPVQQADSQKKSDVQSGDQIVKEEEQKNSAESQKQQSHKDNEQPVNNTKRAIAEAKQKEDRKQTDEEFRTNIADADGNVTPITLSNGMRAFVKDGDPENQLGIVTIAYYEGRNLKFGQVYGKDVQSVGETIPLDQYNKEHGEVPGLPEGFKKGDEIGLSYEGNNFKAEVVGMSDNGKMVLRDPETGDTGEYEPGVVIDMKKKYEQAIKEAEKTKDQMPMREDGEEDWQATTPERAHAYIFNEAGLSRSEGNEFISAQIKAAQSALAKAKSSKMPKVGTSIKKYHETIEKRQEKIDEAQRMFDYWQKVRDIQNGIQREENERRRSEQAALHDEAVIEEQQRQEKEIDKREEQAQRGAHAVHPAIRDKWEAAPKIEGAENEITLANGERVKGRYMLVESGVATPSHNPTNDFTRNDGFPVDENGQTVNDRDYERDKDAQDITRLMAANYDSRAIQSVPVVSNDGVVLSGNGRTMAGELAARDNTDGAYIEHLKKYPQQFGFTREQVEGMQHPRVLFVPDEAMPYTTDTFAKFNQQDMKSQSRTEQSVKLGKTVDDATFGRIIQSINAFDSLNDFYQDATATTNAIGELRSAGVINTMQYAEMFDGEKVSGVGRQMLENMLIGKAFESNPDAIRQLSEFPAMRQSVISALAEITNNIKLGEEYSVEDELAGAISLVYQARKSGTKAGEPVSWYARQLNLFPFDMGETVADYTNATVLMLADQLNGSKINQLKNWMAIYNHASTDAANGQLDIFSGGIKSKQDIVKEALNVLNYGTDKEKRAALDAAREQRKSAAEQSRGSESVQQASVGDVSEQANDASVVAKEDSNAVRTAVAEAEADTNTEPTEAQKEAGNYKKGHVKVDGMDVTIEQPRGSIRRGTDADGKHWEQEMHNTYGYIRGTEGVDGDHIDVFLSDDPSQGDVFVVDQVNKDGSFDEHKVMYGFPDIESARKAYLSNYEEGWQGLGAITPVSKEEFKKWIDSSHRKTKPFAEYSSVKPLDDAQHREYTIEKTSYTNKRGKTTPMHLVTFSRELSKEEIRAGKELAKKSRGWWDAKQGGFMMRSEESAKELADALGNDDAVQDAQPLSVDDVATVNDRVDLKAIDDTFKVDKREPQKTQQDTPQYDGEREENVYDKTLTGLRNVINDRKHGAIPSIKNIEKVIRDLRKRAKTIEDGMATAAGDTISQAFDALADLNGKRRAYEQFLTDIRTKMADTEREDALAAHGVKLGDKVIYKGNECTIHDANNGQVTLDIGLGPVVYEVADWKDVEIPKHAKESQKFEQKQSKQEELPKSKWVNDEDADRFEELRKRLREKLRGQVNMGVDPEVFAIGVEMSYLMLKKGARKFNEFAKNLIDALGEEVRPYIKAFYNGARDLPEMEEYEKDMTPYEEVRKFDLLNFGKNEKDLVKKIEHIAQENEVMRQAEEAKNKIKKERNEARKEAEQEIATNTEVIASKAETLAGEAESKLASARNERELNGITRKIDDTIDEVNDQLALLGYYEADPVDRDYNEAYGYMRNAEKKVVKNVTALFKTLTKELGIEDPVVYNAKGKKQKSVTANIAPAGGDVSMRIMLNRDKDVELYIDFMLDPDGDNLKLKDIMYRPERNRNSLGSNNFFPADVTVQQMLSGIRRVCKPWLSEESPKIIKNSTKGRNSQKKTLSLQQIPDLFSGLFDNNKLNDESDDTATTRQAENGSRTDRKVGSVSAVRDRVLGTNGTRQADGEGLAEISKSSEPVADGKRTGISGRRSSGSSERGNNLSGEAEQKLSYRGRSLRNGNGKDGGDANRATSTEAGGVQNREEGTDRGAQRRLAQRLEPRFKHNYTYPENSSEIDNMTPQQRMTANVEALEVLRNLMRDGREATPEEKEILGRYRGWGGVNVGMAYSTSYMRRSATDVFGRNTSEGNKLLNRLADVIDELDPDGERGILSSINRAALTSYYTPTEIAKTMNNFIKLAGFNGGSYLDPSMGNGVFEGTMPKDIQQRTMIHGVELDWLTGQIAKNLYPDANVQITGYEQAGTADNAYDVVVSNIPFGDISVNDKSWKHDSSPVRKAAQNRIHNYFAVKMLDNTRPGGLCVIMTSNAILDTKGNQIIREHLADHAEILGVVRLPDNTFKGAGTKVVTDVLFLRKFKDDVDRTVSRNDEYINNIEKPFLSSSELKLVNSTDGKTYSVSVNGYFDKHKNMMIGEAKAGGQYRADQFGLSSDLSTDDLAKKMNKLIEKNIVGNRSGQLFDTHKTKREVHQAISEAYKGNGNYISSGNIVEQDGKIGIMTSTKNKYGDVTSTFTEMPSLNSKLDRIRAILPIRTAMKRVIDWQIQGEKENRLVEARSELQKAYDNFVNDYGRLNDKENDFLTEDIDGYTIRSLERMKAGKFDGLSDIFTKNTIKPAIDITSVKTATDAISLSLAEYGEINPAYMEDVLGSSWADQCGETIFKTPFSDSYETADAYLSGDVKTKLEQAKKAAQEDKAFEKNVAALEKIQPKDIPFEDINIRMGARWIPSEVYTDFMYDMFGIYGSKDKNGVKYIPEVDQYVLNINKSDLGGQADAWRTDRRSASEIFMAALQDKTLTAYDSIERGDKTQKAVNKDETKLLNDKVQELRTAFEDWIGQDPERQDKLMRLYNDKFNRNVLRKFDGSHLNVAGLMGKELRPHQKDAVWMLINNRGGIVDHIVGAGKTLVMQSAIMEMRRMGIAKKPMIIALKATVSQIAKEFHEAYPAARILYPSEKDFAKNNRKKFMSQIALNDYDCVILSHDQYCMLPHTDEVERSVINEQKAQLDAAIEYLYGQNDKGQLTKKQLKGLERRKLNLEAKLDKLSDRKVDKEFTFESLGVDYLFVDECQHFKSLPYVTTYDRVAGLGAKDGSQRAVALLNGVRYLQKMHQGDQGTIFLSGTTISNSLSEIYNLMNYLRPSEMQRLGLTTFDAWASNFAKHTAEIEYGVTNELKEKDRFRSLTNIPELSKMYAEIADVRNDMNLQLPKPKMKSHIVTVPQSDAMKKINDEIINMVKSKNGSYFGIEAKDNTPWGLLASTLSAKVAINPRLIDETLSEEGGKIPYVCENVKKIYDKFKNQKGTQLIFCDTGVSGKGKAYDAYSDIINRLVNDYGIPRKEIADIHEANTDEKRKALFSKVNDGSVRILLGGTKNMGTGVNVQKRIVAMHHVDVPWTPADREQREGRGVRQGNEIAKNFNDNNVDVYFYAAVGSLDMYKYQLQETKGKLFTQFKSGTVGDRTFDEGDADGDFDAAEVVATLSGNPVIFEKSKQDKKVDNLLRSKRAYENDWRRRKLRYDELQNQERNFNRLIRINAQDARGLEKNGFIADADGKYPTTVTVSVKDNRPSRMTFDKPKEAGAYIHKLLKDGKQIILSGFGQTATVIRPITSEGLFEKPIAQMENLGGIRYKVEVSDDDTAAGVAFRNLLQKVYSNKDVYERKLSEAKKQLVGADPGEDNFPKQAELDAAIAEQKRLNEEYQKLSDESHSQSTTSNNWDDPAVYRIREDVPPTKTGVGYKVFSSQTGDDLFRVMNTPDKRLHGATRAEVETEGRRTAERLGGSKAEFVDSAEAPDEVRTKIESGKNVKGWYDPNTGKVYVLKDKATSKEDVQHTIFHEKLGHEGLSALLGGQEAVNKFGNFIYLSADANLRDLINKKAKELGKSALDKDGMSIAAQEVFADIAENGPRSAEEFNIWRKVKYYLIQAAKKMGITFHGMLNDDDMRYYVLKTGEALKHWDNMDATTKEDIQYPSMYRETYTDDKGNKHDMPPKPRKKKNESFMNFKNRMEEWEKKSEALKDESDPIPAEFNMDTDKEAQDEWNDIMESWKERHGLIGEQPESIPDRAIGQSDEDYLSSIKNYEKWSQAAKDKDDPIPDMFDFLGKKQKEYYQRYFAWKARHQIADEMNMDLAIYGNATEKYPDRGKVIDEQYHLLEDEKTPEEKDIIEKVNDDIIHEIGDTLGVDTSPEGVKKIVKYSVIDRRKDIESMNAENAIEIHNIDKDIAEIAKQMEISPEKLNSALMFDLEHDRRLYDIANKLNNTMTFIFGHLRPLTKENIEAVEPLLRELSTIDNNRNEDEPIPEEVETKAAQIATKLNSLYYKLSDEDMEKARKKAEAKHDRVLAGIAQSLNNTQTFVHDHLTITPSDLMHVESMLEHLRSMVAGLGDGFRSTPMNDLAGEIARSINALHHGEEGFIPLSGEEIMDVLPVITRNTKVPMEETYAPYFAEDILATLSIWKQPLDSGLDYDKEKVLPIMQKIRSWYDQFYSLLDDAGLKRDDTGFVQNYVNHMWDEGKSDPNAYQALVGENFQRKNSRNMRKRVVSTYLEGIGIGLVPRFDKITDLMAFYGTENAQAIANRRMLDDLAGVNVLETNSDGEVVNKLPLLTTHQPNALEIEKYSYYKVPGIGALWCYNGGGKVIKGIKVSGGVDSRFGTVFGQLGNPADHSSQNVLWHLYDLAADTAKKIQLSLSGFHAGALTEVYIAQGLSQFGPTKTVKNLMRYLVNPALHGELPGYSNPDDFKMAAKHLVKLGATDDYAASEVEALSEKFKNFWTNLRKEAEKKGAAGKIAGVGITVPEFASAMLDFVNKGTDKILWDYLHDGLKIASFKMFSDDINKRFSMGQFDSVKREQLLDEAGQYVNDMFGGQYWELINVSPKFLKGLRRLFLSPDWLVSTNRHFLGTFGFGSLYSDSSMKNYIKFNLDNLKRAFGADIEKDYNRSLRSKSSKLCYGIGVLLFYQLAANALNAYMRKTDQQNEAEKAAKDPTYADKYKLAYPDGMKWYDYLMYSNASGKGTHIFGGRYKDGKEMYIRWGKQFREFPEMFFDDNWHLSFPAQIWERIFTKANPMIHLVSDLTGFYRDYNNTAQDEEIKSKYGKEVGTLVKLINYYLPYSLNTQDNKEFRMTDLVFPSSKGYNNHKAQDDFKKYIMNGDTPGISKTYQNCILNGINPQLQMKAAIASIKADTKTEMNDGITDLGTAKEAFEKAKTVEEKKNYKNKILKYLANENYGDYSMQNAIDEAKDILTGQAPNKESNDVYISKATYQDVLDDYRLSSIRTKVKKHTDIINDLRETDLAKAKAYYDSHRKWFEIDNVIKKANKQINAYKKLMKKGKGDASTMNKIREVRTKALRELEGLNPTMYK